MDKSDLICKRCKGDGRFEECQGINGCSGTGYDNKKILDLFRSDPDGFLAGKELVDLMKANPEYAFVQTYHERFLNCEMNGTWYLTGGDRFASPLEAIKALKGNSPIS